MYLGILTVVIFYYFTLGSPQLLYFFKRFGYEKAPVFWILFFGGSISLIAQIFPDEFLFLFPRETLTFLIFGHIILFVLGILAKLELIGRHPQHNIFLKNKMEFMFLKPIYLIVKAPEILAQQVMFGIMALLFLNIFNDPYSAILYSALFIGVLHIPAFLFLSPFAASVMIISSISIAIVVGLSVLTTDYGISLSLIFHWLLYLGAIPYAWRRCEREVCPIT